MRYDGDMSSPTGCVLDGSNYFRENFLTVANFQPSGEDQRCSSMWILMAGESVSALCHLCLMSTSRKPEADKEIDFTFSLASHHKPRQYQAKTWASEKMENIHSENKLLNVFFKDNSLNIE